MDLASASRSCPAATSASCGNVLNNDYEDDISCASSTEVSCGPATTMSVLLNAGNGYGIRTRRATRCLIHADSEGATQGQDEIIGSGAPLTIQAGRNYPIGSGSLNGETVSRSDSVVTVPLFDGLPLCTGPGTCGIIKVVGFLQIGITQTVTFAANQPQVRGIILNAVGCTGTAPGVLAGTTSPVAVRLIHP